MILARPGHLTLKGIWELSKGSVLMVRDGGVQIAKVQQKPGPKGGSPGPRRLSVETSLQLDCPMLVSQTDIL